MKIRLKTFYYYRLFFNFNYYLFLVPYRVQLVRKSHPYVLISGGYLRQLTCIIFHIILCLTSITVLWGSFIPSFESQSDHKSEDKDAKTIREDPLRLFQLARAIGFPAYTFTLFTCIWWRKHHFVHLLKLVARPERICTIDVIKISSVTTLTCILALISAPFYMLGEDYFRIYDNGNRTLIATTSNWDTWDFYKSFYSYAGTVSHNLLLQPSGRPLVGDELTPWIVAVTFVYGFLNIYLIILIHFADTFVMIGALAIHDIAKELASILSADSKEFKSRQDQDQDRDQCAGGSQSHAKKLSVEKLLKYYGEVKDLIEHINGGTGPMVVSMFFVTLPYFVENLATLFDQHDWPLKIRFVYYFIHYFASIIIAAEANRLLNEIKVWVIQRICEDAASEHHKYQVDYDVAVAVNENIGIGGGDGSYFKMKCALPTIEEQICHLGDMDYKSENQTARKERRNDQLNQKMTANDQWKLTLLYLEASSQNVGLRGCGFFTITYGFMGSIIGILVTYFIVMVQFRAQIPSAGMAAKLYSPFNTRPVIII